MIISHSSVYSFTLSVKFLILMKFTFFLLQMFLFFLRIFAPPQVMQILFPLEACLLD